MPKKKLQQNLFYKLAHNISEAVGSPLASIAAVTIILIWVVTGPFFNFSNMWQSVINTGTAIVTFLMVFLLQNSPNHDAKAVQIKLDELIRSIDSARNQIINVENSSAQELQELQQDFFKSINQSKE